MKNLHEVLMLNPTAEQLDLLSNYPTVAVEYAIDTLKNRHEQRSFNYFLGIVKNFIAKGEPKARTSDSKKETQGAQRFNESPNQKDKLDEVLARAQERIRARNASL